jgi:hypothetical protein
MDPYARALALLDAQDHQDRQKLEQWAIAEARHNDRLRAAGQRLADELKQLRKVGNTDQIDAVLNAWRHALSR